MTSQEATEYIKKEKSLIDQQGSAVESIVISLSSVSKVNQVMVASDNFDAKFILSIIPSSKIGVKISLHFMTGDKQGLARLDYYGSHRNPPKWEEGVPEKFKQYADKLFENESHLHEYVEGYDLEWALPIEDTPIEPKQIEDSDILKGRQEAIDSFCQYMNIKGKIILK